MDFFTRLFNVFSRRPDPNPERERKPLTRDFCQRVLMRLREVLADNQDHRFWEEICRRLRYLYPTTCEYGMCSTEIEDVSKFLQNCNDKQWLDFFELMFQVNIIHDANEFVADINGFFRLDDLPYQLTELVTEERPGTYRGSPCTERHTLAYPQIIRRDEDVVHKLAVMPALKLLQAPYFHQVNREYLEAHGHYRKGEHDKCTHMCGCTVESTIKVICDRRSWSYDDKKDTLSKLLEIYFRSATIEPFFQQSVMIVGTMRNRYGAHGKGSSPTTVPEPIAEYALNLTASSVLLLVKSEIERAGAL